MSRVKYAVAITFIVLIINCCVAKYQALPHGGKIWALLVAGSKEFYNYRHQADLCHAYQILHNNGIPDENIVVMMYDDIAHSAENPTPGFLINEPNGSDVYHGVPKDYTENSVNASVFLSVLRGDKEAVKGIGSGRVIDSGPHDHVFVNFVDHGAPGLLAMPNDLVYASQLLSTLQQMSASSKFAKLVLYIEACESGSMFDTILPDDMNIFATTAADPHESSYACYFDKDRNTYLGDLFSVMWMQNTEQEDLSRATLHHQFEVVRTRTNSSHVEEYGDLNVGSMLLRDFIGFSAETANRMQNVGRRSNAAHPGTDVVPARDVPLVILQKRVESENNAIKKQRLEFELHRMKKLRHELERQVKGIVRLVLTGTKTRTEDLLAQRMKISNIDCYERSVRKFDATCYNIAQNPHAMSQLYAFVNLCEQGYSAQVIENAIENQCGLHSHHHHLSIGIH